MRVPQFLYALWRLSWRFTRPRTRGVRVMVYDDAGRLLLVRNTYGDTQSWVLPGGGVGKRETPEAAAEREVMEEVGCATRGLAQIATFESNKEGKRDTIYLFRASTSDVLRMQADEIAEAGLFGIDELPEKVSPATRRRIREQHEGVPVAAAW